MTAERVLANRVRPRRVEGVKTTGCQRAIWRRCPEINDRSSRDRFAAPIERQMVPRMASRTVAIADRWSAACSLRYSSTKDAVLCAMVSRREAPIDQRIGNTLRFHAAVNRINIVGANKTEATETPFRLSSELLEWRPGEIAPQRKPCVVGPAGFEPATFRLKVCCSAN